MAIHVPFSHRPSGQIHRQGPIYIGFEQPRRNRRKINWWGVNSVVLFFLSAGVLSPITLLMGLNGLRRRPRTAAVAGTALSLLGVLAMAGIVFLAVSHERYQKFQYEMARQNDIVAAEVNQTQAQLAFAAAEFEQYRDDHDGKLPIDMDGSSLAIKHVDPWGEELLYETDRDGATLRSAGPDREFFSSDDVTYDMDGETSYQPLLPVE